MTAEMTRLIEPLIPALRRYARALLRDRAAADDLVQDCLERVIGRWHQRRAEGETRAWIFAILHNLAMTRLRRAASRPQAVPLELTSEADLAGRASQEDALRCRDVLSALSRLPDEQRMVLLLVAVEDLSYAETAKVLDLPIGTVMSRLSRARERLHLAISEEVRPEGERPHLRRVK
ncbi:sigma-70 family RNA polymerase sigma factor [Roseixanthobacter liquoris]|uniref:sigma-70 family RNA polymerase sigma factor n=1 Tax=Roseixanthobacter liquoris TaxID=3119921 RepID=UPI0037296470